MSFKYTLALLLFSAMLTCCSQSSNNNSSSLNSNAAPVSGQGLPVVDASAFPQAVPKSIDSSLPNSPQLTAQQKSDFMQLFSSFNAVAEPTFTVVGSAQSTSLQIQSAVLKLPVSEQMLAYALEKHCAIGQPVVTNVNPRDVPTVGSVTSAQTKSTANGEDCEVNMSTNLINQKTIIVLAQNLLNSISNVQQYRRVDLLVQSGNLVSSAGLQGMTSEIQALGRAEVGFSGGAREYEKISGHIRFILSSGELADFAVTGEVLNQDQLTSQTQFQGQLHGVQYVVNVQTLFEGGDLATKVYLNGEYLENGIPGLQFLQ